MSFASSASTAVFVSAILCGSVSNGEPPYEVPPKLPAPYATKSVIRHPKVIGWPKGKSPVAPDGFKVTALAADIESPRWLYALPNGDVLVAQSRTMPKPEPAEDESSQEKAKKEKMAEGMKKSHTVTGDSPNQVTLLRDSNGDGTSDERYVFLKDLEQPLGMALVNETLFVANTNAVMAYPFKVGQTEITVAGTKIVDLPAGGYNNHWTRNLIANVQGDKLYVSIGSASNVAEHGTAEELLRANILQMNLDGTDLRVYASGLRNPVGMAWEPTSGQLWTAVNERDELGDDLVPDYITHVEEAGFYGWPYAYYGPNEDPRLKGVRPDLVQKTIVPDVDLGSHTASLGLAFYDQRSFPERYRGGAFIGQRGSWNRSKFVGYRVAFVPFANGRAAGPPEDFLTGFIANEADVYGRPVGVAVAKDGALLVADEPGNIVWRISAE